jgi:hypothetical protein
VSGKEIGRSCKHGANTLAWKRKGQLVTSAMDKSIGWTD